MKIAVVDDQHEDADVVKNYIERFVLEHQAELSVDVYLSSIEFLETYTGQYDIICLDVEMPGSTGLEAAEEIRQMDETAALMFITSVARYAIDGYRYQALDFMVKPIEYGPFSYKLQKAIDFARDRRLTTVEISVKEGRTHLYLKDILYLDKNGNYVQIHMKNGNLYETRASMKEIRDQINSNAFQEVTSGCIVNLNYVNRIEKELVVIGDVRLPLSRRMRKEFLNAFMDFVR